MNKETYEALKIIVRIAKGNKGVAVGSYIKEFKQVEAWIDEVGKEYQDE